MPKESVHADCYSIWFFVIRHIIVGDIYVCILQPQQQSVHFYDLAVQFYELYSIFVHFCDLYTGKEIYERQGLTNSILIKKI